MRIASLAQQSRTLEWGVEKRVVKDRDMRKTSDAQFQFSVKAVYDLLPTPVNKNRWFRTDQYSCHLCGGNGTLQHILTGCKVALAQGRYTWRHNRVLRELGTWLEEKRKSSNSIPWKRRGIKFIKAGEKSKPTTTVAQPDSVLKIARDWKMLVDLPETPLSVPTHIAVTAQRPDIIITSDAMKLMFLIELTCPMEGRCEVSTELKTDRYERDVVEAAKLKGWKTVIYTVEVGCRGFPAPSITRMLRDFGFTGKKRREILKKLSIIAEESSMKIWKSSQFRNWGER